MITRIEKFRICYTPNPLGVSNPTLHLSGSPKLLTKEAPRQLRRAKAFKYRSPIFDELVLKTYLNGLQSYGL